MRTFHVLCKAYFALASPTNVHCFFVVAANRAQQCRLLLADIALALPMMTGWVTFTIQFAPLVRRQVCAETTAWEAVLPD